MSTVNECVNHLVYEYHYLYFSKPKILDAEEET